MPYTTSSENLPEHVRKMPEDKRRQWVEIFNSTLESTGDEAQAFAAANGAVKAIKCFGDTVKALDDETFGGYGVVFSDPDTPDLEDDYFDASSYFWPDIPTSVVIYDHALGLHPGAIQADGSILIDSIPPFRFRIGNVTKRVQDERGIYIEFKMTPTIAVYNDRLKTWEELVDEEHQGWLELIKDKLKDGTFNYSSDSMGHLVEREFIPSKGVFHIKSWPLPAISITPKAAEPRAQISQIKAAGDGAKATANQAGRDVSAAQRSFPNIEENKMELNTKALIQAFVSSQWDAIKSYIKQEEEEEQPADETKQSEGEIHALLLPVAEQIAAMSGVAVEEVLPDLLALVMAKLAPAPEEVPVTEDAMSMYDEEGGYMTEQKAVIQIDSQSFAKAYADITQKRGAAVLNQGSGSGHYKTNNVNINRGAKPARTLQAIVKAIVRKNNGALKAMGIDPDSAGGYLVPVEQSNQVIELLRSKSLFMGDGPATSKVTVVPMASNTLTIPRLDTGITTSWIGENTAITESQAELGQIVLVAKKMATLVPISNELLDDSDPDVDALLRDDIARAVANEFDRVILNGSGTATQPRGISNVADVTITDINGIPTYAQLLAAITRVLEADVEEDDSMGWVIRPRQVESWRQLEDTQGNLIWSNDGYPSVAAPPITFLGYPYWASTINKLAATAGASLTNSATQNSIYFGRWRDAVVGMRKTLEIAASSEAGNAFANDQTLIRAILRMDVQVRHPESFEILARCSV